MTQYIGARYVPKFMGTYDATQAYENMCVVDNGMGTSYISSKPTPAGTPLTDTEYWAIYGASNGAIINLQNQIDTINNTDLPAIDARLDLLEAKKVVIIADSYGMVHPTTFLSILKNAMPDIYDGIGISSIGFTPVSPYTFSDQFDNFINGYTTDEKNAVTDVIFCGGWNDAREIESGNKTVSDLAFAIQTTINHVLSVCPNAIVHSAFMAWHSYRSLQNQVSLNSLTKTMSVYHGSYHKKYVALTDTKYPMRDINCMDSSLFHPNDTEGASALAQVLHENLFSGSAHYRSSNTYTASFLDSNAAGLGSDFKLRVSIDDNITRLSMDGAALMNGTPTGGIIGVWNSAHTPVILPGKTTEVGKGNLITMNVLVKGELNGVTYSNYTPALLYLYGDTGNILLVTPSGQLATSLVNAYLYINATIDNETCV